MAAAPHTHVVEKQPSDESDPPDDEETSRPAPPNGPSSDSTVPSEAPREAEEELLEFHLGAPNRAQKTRVAPPAPPALQARQSPQSFRYAGVCMNYCMTMCCLEEYGTATTHDSIFHSKEIPRISVRHYMDRFFGHPALSPSAMLAGLLLIFRFSFVKYAVNVYSVHRLILTGASVGLKVQDDVAQGVPYLASLGGVSTSELIALQNTFCSTLQWNLFFHPQDYVELLEVMEQMLADPHPGELEAFRSAHQEEIGAFNVKRLRVTEGMLWFLSEYDSPPSDSQDVEGTRLKAVFALHRWNTIMKPWLFALRQRCEQRDGDIQRIMKQDFDACAAASVKALSEMPSSPLRSSSYSHSQGSSEYSEQSGWPSYGGRRQPWAAPAYDPHAFSGSPANFHRDPVGRTTVSHSGGRISQSVMGPDCMTRHNFGARIEGSGSGSALDGREAQPKMNKLTYAKPYVRSSGARSQEGYEPGLQKPMIGQKRTKPSNFTDNYIQ